MNFCPQFQTCSCQFRPTQFVRCRRFFLELNSKELCPGSKRERNIHWHYVIKHCIRWFSIIAMLWMSKKCTKKCERVVVLLSMLMFSWLQGLLISLCIHWQQFQTMFATSLHENGNNETGQVVWVVQSPVQMRAPDQANPSPHRPILLWNLLHSFLKKRCNLAL